MDLLMVATTTRTTAVEEEEDTVVTETKGIRDTMAIEEMAVKGTIVEIKATVLPSRDTIAAAAETIEVAGAVTLMDTVEAVVVVAVVATSDYEIWFWVDNLR